MSTKKLMILCVLGAIVCLSLSSNPPQGNTGAPFEGACSRFGCHFGSSGLTGEISIVGIPEIVERGKSYDFNVQIVSTNGSPIRAGFQMVAVDSDEQNAGILSDAGVSSTISSFNDRSYFEHQPAQRFENGDTISYSANWTAPSEFINDGITTFYLSSIIANGSNGPTGDSYLTHTYDVILSLDTMIRQECDKSIYLESPIDDVVPGDYTKLATDQGAIANNKVQANGELYLLSKNGVELKPNFEVEKRGVFGINIQSCLGVSQ